MREGERNKEESERKVVENGILGSEANLLHGCICVTEE